ncbi:TPA: hypothetical protein GF663_23815 [Escherichia coli]|nr:hypothetical protein [Escherichia coli]
MSNRFYMMCSRETVGNNASFHCHNGNGYSSVRGGSVYDAEAWRDGYEAGKTPVEVYCDEWGG